MTFLQPGYPEWHAAVDRWNAAFPERGEELVRALAGFYNWDRQLRPRIDNLESLAHKAIFWRSFEGIQFLNEIQNLDSTPSSRRQPSGRHRVVPEISCRPPLIQARTTYLVSLRPLLKSEILDFRPPQRSIVDDISHLLELLCIATLMKDGSFLQKLQPLLGLYLAGNYPRWIESKSSCLVIETEEEK